MISSNNSKSKNAGIPSGGLIPSSTSNISTSTVANALGLVNTAGPNVIGSNNGSGDVSTIPVLPDNEVTSLSDIRSYLQPISNSMSLPPGVCPYDHIIEMIRGLDLQDDGITMNHKIKSIETDFCNIVRDENMLCESMEYINDKALEDGETALKFALLFASHNFDALAMKETKVRTAMLTLLQKNFLNAENYRVHDRERFYNSITLLGEYYHRVRLADNSPINILGESLLGLLIREIKEEKNMNDVKLAKLILSQITLNGDLMRNLHKTEISQLLYHIRKNLIEQPNLKPTVKAIMLMTLDLFYSNFASLGSQLEVMYTKYFIMEDDDEGNNNQHLKPSNQQQPLSSEVHLSQQQQPQSNISPQQKNFTSPSTQLQQLNSYDAISPQSSSHNTSYENGDSGNVNDNTEDDPVSYKKWSEQVCEDSFEEYNGVESELNLSGSGQDQKNKSNGGDREKKPSSNRSYDNDSDRQSRNFRRSFQPRQSPRPLKQSLNSNEQLVNCHDSQNSGNEERDETKPLPRWRAPRFNRDDQNKDIRSRNAQRRFSASFDDDRQSIRSDGGSIRLYSINDRLKHAQEKIERSDNQSAYAGIANSNWDRQSQRDDRSERSYMSNYERGNNNRRGGGRHYNNWTTYDKPPRFQKNKNAGGNSNPDKNSDTWRSSNSNLQYVDENSSYNSNGPESNSRSSSRARTLPRPAKSRIDNNNKQNNTYRRSQSPNIYQRGGGGVNNFHHNQHQNKSRTPKFNSRYSSQSSLASDASSTLDRRHHQKNRSFSRRSSTQQPDHSNDSQHWNDKDTNSELVRNARQTTDYMNYLSSKK